MRRSAVLGLAMLATLAAAPGVRAQLGVEAIANYAGLDRQMILEQGARRERSLLLYTTGTQIKPLVDRFEQKYPYLKVELARASSADTARDLFLKYDFPKSAEESLEIPKPAVKQYVHVARVIA